MKTTKIQLITAMVRPGTIVGCFIIGCACVDRTHLIWPIIAGAAVLMLIAVITCMRSRFSEPAPESFPLRQQRVQSEETAKYVQDLFSPYTRCAASAAEHLGRIGDAGVVPSLISVLDRSAWREEPGWEQVSTAIVLALASIGDGRALTALNRVIGARGVDFRDAVNSAIASITNVKPHDLTTSTARSLNGANQVPLNGAVTQERVLQRRVALVPLGDIDAFQDDARL